MAETFSGAVNAAALQSMKFPPPTWIVPNIVPAGTTVLVSDPKVGKSCLALQIARELALTADVLYLALEDTPTMLQRRLALQPGPWPPRLLLVPTGGAAPGDRGAAQIAEWLRGAFAPRLFIVDTLELMRGEAENGRQYRADYQAVRRFKVLADRHNVSCLLVHHTNKRADDGTKAHPFWRISSTQGLMAAADSAVVLDRDVGAATGMTTMRSRCAPESVVDLAWTESQCSWSRSDGTPLLERVERVRSAPELGVLRVLTERGEMPVAAVWRALATDFSNAEILGAVATLRGYGELCEQDGRLRCAGSL